MTSLYERFDDALVEAAQDDEQHPLAFHLTMAMRRWIEDQLDREYVRTRIAEQLDIPFTEVRDVIDLLVEAVLSP